MTPLSLPALGPAKQSFEILSMDASAPEASGALGGVQIGLPRWEARYTLGDALLRATSDDWGAIFDRLKRPGARVFAYDYKRPLPLAYASGFTGLMRAGGGAFDGSATGWTLGSDRDSIELSGLPAGFQISVRDYLMFRWVTGGEARRHLVRFVAKTSASGAGVATTLFEPPLPGLVPENAVADFNHPCCIMGRLEMSAGEIGRRGVLAGSSVRFLQDLRP